MNIDFWPKNPKANLEMNVSSVIKMSYEQKTMKYDNKNKPKTKPIQTQSNPILSAAYSIENASTLSRPENAPIFSFDLYYPTISM